MNEIQKKEFGDALVRIALAQQEATAARLGFDQVFIEMKERDFARMLEEIATRKRDTKAAKLAKILQLLFLERRNKIKSPSGHSR